MESYNICPFMTDLFYFTYFLSDSFMYPNSFLLKLGYFPTVLLILQRMDTYVGSFLGCCEQCRFMKESSLPIEEYTVKWTLEVVVLQGKNNSQPVICQQGQVRIS